MAEFINRAQELDELTARYGPDRAEFVICYGRRRLGRNELVRRSVTDRDDPIYYSVIESTERNQLEGFRNDEMQQQLPAFRHNRDGKYTNEHDI